MGLFSAEVLLVMTVIFKLLLVNQKEYPYWLWQYMWQLEKYICYALSPPGVESYRSVHSSGETGKIMYACIR